MYKEKINWEEVNATMREQFKVDCKTYGWLKILQDLTGLTRAVDSFKHGEGSKKADFCPIHGGKKGDKFSLLPTAEEDGGGWCFKCGEKVDGFENIMLSNGVDFKDAVILVKELIYTNGVQPYPWDDQNNSFKDYGSSSLQKPKPIKSYEVEELSDWDKKIAAQRKADNNALLGQSVPINHESAMPLREYFLSRSIDSWGDFGDSLRYHPLVNFTEKVEAVKFLKPSEIEEREAKLTFLRNHRFYVGENMSKDGDIYCNMGEHPAALFIMRNNNTMKATSLQRIYLSLDGKKMELDGHYDITVKKRTAKIPGVTAVGSSCHIDSPAMKVIGVAEGPETTLSVRAAIGLPMNCTVDAGGLGNWIPNDTTDRVIVFVDKDLSGAGMTAALKLKERLEKEFIEVILLEPPLNIPKGSKSVDWLDAVQALGVSAFPDWLINWERLEI